MPSDSALGREALGYLTRIVSIDSASDESSPTVPSTPGQARLADEVGGFFAELGATVERDEFANIIATFPGVGRGAEQRPIALMVHLDTARGTHAVKSLNVLPNWQGDRVPYPANPSLCVDVETYPATALFLGQDLVYGAGDAPFGLDDKLGLCHLMTLGTLLAKDTTTERPPVLMVGRPDEEIGRVEALLGLAKTLAARDVDFGYTIDGLLPFEINVENFNAAGATVQVASRVLNDPPSRSVKVELGGVNTHGATAAVEGHRAATRFGAEILAALKGTGIVPVTFTNDALRDCDATVIFRVADAEGRAKLKAVVEAVVGPHIPRGASWSVGPLEAADGPADGAVVDALSFIGRFINDQSLRPLLPEDSDGRQGYSNPYRIRATEDGVIINVRLRDFTPKGLADRKAHVVRHAQGLGEVCVTDQYGNMGPRLADRPELVEWPALAAKQLGIDAKQLPIRGGTGVDPFLDAGVPVANLGTGYFAPESEKEFTSLQLMAQHARWLHALLPIIVAGRTRGCLDRCLAEHMPRNDKQ